MHATQRCLAAGAPWLAAAAQRSAAALGAARRVPHAPTLHRLSTRPDGGRRNAAGAALPRDDKMARWAMDKTPANYAELSPLSFLQRVARAFPDRAAAVHGAKTYTWAQTAERARRLASALARRGITRGDTVAVVASNTPEMNECHFGVPMAGAVLLAINTRLDPAAVAFALEHSEAALIITDTEFAPMVREALGLLRQPIPVIDICDSEVPHFNTAERRLGEAEYEQLLQEGDADFAISGPRDEWDPIALGYTSGTTGVPKGVVTHHRGAYLNALSNAVGWDMGHHPRYMWTLPMFHCNGWCFPWTLAAVAGTSICLRKVTAESMYHAISHHGATHLCGAPIILNTLASAPPEVRLGFSHTVKVMTAAAPPPPSTLQKMQTMGFDVTHVYGLTETYGPAVINAWKPEWNDLPLAEQARLRARQGVNYHALEDVQVLDPDTMAKVPADGETLGEVMFRGNIVMKGYLKNEAAMAKDFRGGWFHSGDLGVMHPDGYIELKDRSKDIIISGGENISSIEVENALMEHAAVAVAAVIARPDDKWGETPCAFIELHPGHDEASLKEELIGWCRGRLAAYKIPRSVVFQELPRTSTGKLQKFKLREQVKQLVEAERLKALESNRTGSGVAEELADVQAQLAESALLARVVAIDRLVEPPPGGTHQ